MPGPDLTTARSAPTRPAPSRWARLRDGVAWGSVLIFAASAWLGTTVAHIALAVVALMTIMQGPTTWRRLGRDPFVRLSGVFLVYLAATAAWAAHQRPETAHDQWSALWPWSSLWLFFVLGWWLQGSWPRVVAVLTLAPLGLAISVMRRTDWHQLPAWLSGTRYEFGYSALGLSFLCVVIVLGITAVLPRLAHASRGGGYRRLRLWLAIAGMLFFLFILFVAQSRGAWLSLLLGFGGLGLAGLRIRAGRPARHPAAPRRHLLVPLGLCVAALAALWGLFGNALEARFASEAGLLPQVVNPDLDLEKLPYSNGPARIHLAVWGFRMAAERPLLGWGPGMRTTAYLADHGFHGAESRFLKVIRHFQHLHNVYVEILVRFGVVGVALFGSAFVLFSRTLWTLWRDAVVPNAFFAFSAVTIVVTLFSGLYEFRTLHTDFRFFALLFGAAVYTFALHRAPAADAVATVADTDRPGFRQTT
ncbi:O-antigen ligase family protein [Methylotetracoccus oryzae]|uniref:O-antigen ligase family protein n=1 Tax=Methylotetracoccus oryzae TaxID=1919059 RepID=UPI001118B017|nr:O-antigen ligase family protein [Methylotetracoccus oryzae]